MARAVKRRSGSAVWGWLFLFCVALLYGLGSLTHPAIVVKAASSLGAVMTRILPALALVFVFMVFMNLFAKKEWLGRHIGGARGSRASLLAVVLGIISVGSIYAWYPLLGELREKGVGAAPLAMFLYSRALKLPLLPIMVHYFGVAYTGALAVSIVVFSILSGLIVGRLVDAAWQSKIGD